jgi:hypothetical protein
MSEDRNEATATELGREGVEAEFGYVRMPEQETPPESSTTLQAEIERRKASRQLEDPIEKIEYLQLDSGEKAPENETVTIERAAADLTAYHNQQIDNAAKSISSDFAKAVDKLRADALEANPKAVDELGLSKEEVAAAKAVKTEEAVQDEPAAMEAKQAPSEPDPYLDAIEGLEPETREALKKPQVRQFLETYAAEGEQVKQAYTDGLNNAQQFGQAAILALAPELAQVPLDRWGDGINMIAQADPVRGQQLATMFSNVAAIAQRQQLVTQHEQETARQNFESHVKSEDARLVEMVGSEKAANEANQALINYLGEHGIPRNQMLSMVVQNPVLRTAEARQTIWKAQKYDELLKSPARAAPKPLPPVTRPGTASHGRGNSNASTIEGLERQLASAKGNAAVKLAAKLTAARRSATR